MKELEVGQRCIRNVTPFGDLVTVWRRGVVTERYISIADYLGGALVMYKVKWDDVEYVTPGYMHGVNLFPEPLMVPTVCLP